MYMKNEQPETVTLLLGGSSHPNKQFYLLVNDWAFCFSLRRDPDNQNTLSLSRLERNMTLMSCYHTYDIIMILMP